MKGLKSFLTCLGLSLAVMAGAQAPVASFTVAGGPGNVTLTMAVRPVENEDPAASVVLERDSNGIYKGRIADAASGIYYIYLYNSESEFQTQAPVYLPAGAFDKGPVAITLDGYRLTVSIDDCANRDLTACSDYMLDRSRRLLDWTTSDDTDSVREVLKSYSLMADSALAACTPPESVSQFIRLWCYTAASDAYRMAVHIRGLKKLPTLPFGTAEFLPDPSSVLDSPLAAGLNSTSSIVTASLKGDLCQKMDQLYASYSTPEIREKASRSLLESYISRFNYAKDPDSGEAMLREVTEKYNLGDNWVKQFNLRRCTVPGAPFPAGITLVDREGRTVDFSSFLGKWVYVDLWASWCGPCCREVPFLKQLEKDLASRGDITFVSISTDSSREAWLKKMDQLEMHGNQLLDSGGNLCASLNISGIPHFLVYDPQGRLAVYRASRPSDPATLTMLSDLK